MIRRVLPCACCGYLTILDEYDTCPVCCWVADRIQETHPDRQDGSNRVTLSEARSNYLAFGAAEERQVGEVRPPAPGEIPPSS